VVSSPFLVFRNVFTSSLHDHKLFNRYSVIRQHVVHLGFQITRSMLVSGFSIYSFFRNASTSYASTLNLSTNTYIHTYPCSSAEERRKTSSPTILSSTRNGRLGDDYRLMSRRPHDRNVSGVFFTLLSFTETSRQAGR